MKNITLETNNSRFKILLWVLIIAYVLYFSFFTILRYRTLYSSYFDLGIMHQTVFNTYRALTDRDPSRILELTNPFGPNQIKRPAIHNDIILALLSVFYFIYASPITLLILQSAIIGLGAWFIFQITQVVFEKQKFRDGLSLVFTLCYLLYPALELSNMYEFHAVTLATTFLLAMFYFWLKKQYNWSYLFVILSLFTKEQVGLTTAFFGIYAFLTHPRADKKNLQFSLAVVGMSIFWFVLSLYVIIPQARGGDHFALGYYSEFGDTPTKVLIGIFTSPFTTAKHIFNTGTLEYLTSLLGPLGFLSLLSPLQLLIALPELAINLLSNNSGLRNIHFQYTAVTTPFIFISAIYGTKKITEKFKTASFIPYYLLLIALLFAYLQGPLPGAKKQEVHPFKYPQKEAEETLPWAERFKDENLKISTTGQLAPFFTSRRYFYTFSQYYTLADYVVIRPLEIYTYPERKSLTPAYEHLQRDKRFQLIYKKGNFEVYKRV